MRLTAHALRNRHGSTYLALMFLIVIMAISVTVVAKQWKTVVQREKEADLLWRGIEIQTAIQFFYNERPPGSGAARAKYPLTLEELTKPPKPFLRRVYKDPITGGDWQYIPGPTGGIMGVRSASIWTPIKQHQFPAAVAHFEGFDKYNQWVFLYPSASTPLAQQNMSGQQNPRGGPGSPGPVPPGFPTQQNPEAGAGPPGQVPPGFPTQQGTGAGVGPPGPVPPGFPGQPVPGLLPPPPPGNSAQ
jgi:type II secretory pathway pseudopilin PulG